MRIAVLLVAGLALLAVSPIADAQLRSRRHEQVQCPLVAPSDKPPAKKEPPVDQVKQAIDRGVKYLRKAQRENGGWDWNLPSAVTKGGWTSLALLALLNAGVPTNDPMIAKGLPYLRGMHPESTYVRALQTMVFVEAGRDEDRERISRNVEWLIEARVFKTGEFRGWSYSKIRSGITSDNSNTQFAIQGLHAGKKAGARIKEDIWRSIREYYIRTQERDGDFRYDPVRREGGTSLTMTTAGYCGLLVAGMELNAGREVLQDDGTAQNCGAYKENVSVQKALGWINKRDPLVLNLPQRTFYNLYGIEHAGRLSGHRLIWWARLVS